MKVLRLKMTTFMQLKKMTNIDGITSILQNNVLLGEFKNYKENFVKSNPRLIKIIKRLSTLCEVILAFFRNSSAWMKLKKYKMSITQSKLWIKLPLRYIVLTACSFICAGWDVFFVDLLLPGTTVGPLKTSILNKLGGGYVSVYSEYTYLAKEVSALMVEAPIQLNFSTSPEWFDLVQFFTTEIFLGFGVFFVFTSFLLTERKRVTRIRVLNFDIILVFLLSLPVI
jgi:hypothetical protein